jgi:hypothetical protein
MNRKLKITPAETELDRLFAQAPANAFAAAPSTTAARAKAFEQMLAKPTPKPAARPAPTATAPPTSFPTAASIALEMIKAAELAARAPRPLTGLAALIDKARKEHDAKFDKTQKALTVSLAKRGNETGLARLISAAKLKTAQGK